ncbi:MAG: hypothetical protein J1G02_04880 [Clostridiales bacterium]|nr:hypothetical protein [Clostridiales bacterium]
MNKAKLIAVSGICSAVTVVCLLLASVFPYGVLIYAVIASVAVAMPMLIDGRNLTYSLLVYAASIVVGALSGTLIGNILYVAPIVLFCLPFAIVKVYGETLKLTAKVDRTETLYDPFEQGDDTQVVSVQLNGRKRLPTFVKWTIYYILLELGIFLTLIATNYLTPAVLDRLKSSNWLFWVIIAVAQLVVPLYDILLRGCLIGAVKVMKRVIK